MEKILLHCTDEDSSYLARLKSIISGRAQVKLSSKVPVTYTEVMIAAKNLGISKIATTSEVLLKLLLDGKISKKNDYRGSLLDKVGAEWLILPPMESLVTVPHGSFLMQRYFNKFLAPSDWLSLPDFKWELFHPRNTESLLSICNAATFIAVDIETGLEGDRVITCVGFCAVSIDSTNNTISQTTFVVPFLEEDGYNRAFIKQICGSHTPKVFQNGKYDIAYLLRFNTPVYNYLGDTINLFHCWYCELPKRLDFITSFLLRKWSFWKDESATAVGSMDYYRYNAKDCYATAMCFLTLLKELPQYAWKNYQLEFPLVFPCIMAENRGLLRDNEEMEREEARFTEKLGEQLSSLRKMVGNENYNPNSPKQNMLLLQALGSGDVGSSNKIALDKVKQRHPINSRIFNAVENYRADIKLCGTYLRDKDPKTGETKTWNGRIFYTLNPHGTDTGRLASSESHFWCGWQIHNIPRDRDDIQVRRGILADPGFYLGECDRSQAETRDTAYLSGDKKLIMAVEDKSRDFHGLNASAFFGIPYDKIVNSSYNMETEGWEHKTVDKPLRDLSKRTNHGANYNMGAQVLLNTMGIEKTLKARALLSLPRNWTLLQITQHLLDIFSETYSTVKGAFYDKIKNDVNSTKKLVGPTGWTRYCFGSPSINKRHLNSYVAHVPQSLNAMELNNAYLRVFYEIALTEPVDFKLGPQIHDSILFQYRVGRVDLAYKVTECMNNPIDITDVFGYTRRLTVPTDLKGESSRWSDLKVLKKQKVESPAYA